MTPISGNSVITGAGADRLARMAGPYTFEGVGATGTSMISSNTKNAVNCAFVFRANRTSPVYALSSGSGTGSNPVGAAKALIALRCVALGLGASDL